MRWPAYLWLWYLCISLGFALLALRAWLLGGRTLTIILRCVIAAGFLVLAIVQRRERKR